MKIRAMFWGLLAAVVATGCSIAKSLPFNQPTETPTASPTATFTLTPSPTPTQTPTPTPVPAARIESGERAIMEGDWDKALAEFQTAQQASGDAEVQAAALLGIGRVRLLSGNAYEAIQSLENLLQQYPDSGHVPEAHFFLAKAYSADGHYSDAAEAYLNYMALRPGLIDAYVLDLRGDALFAAGDYAGAARDFQAALQSPSILDGIFVQLKMARSTALSGDFAGAITLYDDLYARTSSDNTKALIDLRRGEAYMALGQIEQGHASFMDAVVNYPSAYESYQALVDLVNAGVVVDELNRGIVDYYAGEYGVALAAFDRYLQNSPADPATARYFNGLAYSASGTYQAAINEWDKVIQGFQDSPYWDDAYEQKAYTQWAFLDQYTLAVQTLLDFVSAAPAHSRAGEFLFDAAQVAERDKKLEQAADLWERVNSQYPGYELAPRALFLAGVSRYRTGDYPGAQNVFQRYFDASTNLGDRAAALLWMGKTKKAQGDDTGAQAEWELAAGTDPTGYYSERARDILRGQEPFTPPTDYDLAVDPAGERARAEAWMRTIFTLPEGTNLSGLGTLAGEGAMARGAELWRLGEYGEARNEFEQLRQVVQGDPVQSYQLANYLADLGLYRSATLAARQVLALAGMDDASTMSAPAYFNHLRFGTYYSDLIMPAAQKYNFHPLFLFSVIRQESLFESFVQSSAAASGLMQIIPATGEEIARNLGWPDGYTQSDLYRPLVSVNFGVNYLNAQRTAFDGDLYSALAAYNGGPGNANEWRKLANGDPDLFLEVVRFSETRTYIRSIYEIFTIYRRIYDRTP